MYITNVLSTLTVANDKRHLSMIIGDDVFRFITEFLICNILAELNLIYIGYLSSLVYIGGHYVFLNVSTVICFSGGHSSFRLFIHFFALSNNS